VESLPTVAVSLRSIKLYDFWLEIHFRGDIYIVEIISRKKDCTEIQRSKKKKGERRMKMKYRI
jgi:hypothetical protein